MREVLDRAAPRPVGPRHCVRGRHYLTPATTLGLAAILALTVPSVHPFPPLLVWNVSASAPVGLYLVSPWRSPRRGDIVVAWTPPPWRKLAAERHYLPANVPLVKRVAATGGDRMCALGDHIYVNGRWVARRLVADGKGRAMPAWQGCSTLSADSLLLLTGDPASFDGRYFGATNASDILGTARLIWAR